ncbi:MAG: hypothetical protein AB8G96_15365 [Phycisphaerales bacterium]
MFSQDAFLQASRNFVCIRIETYENSASESMVRSVLGGPFANTAFVVFSPDGTQRLSRSGRSPSVLLRGRSGDEVDSAAAAREMNRIAARYQAAPESDTPAGPLLQDFESFRQAMNVASADQRLLIVVNGVADDTRQQLRTVLASDEFTGVFHTDQVGDKTDEGWRTSIKHEDAEPSILIVRADTFGQSGKVMAELPNGATADAIRTALKASNTTFAASEARKVHSEHVAAGRRAGIYFENEIPYGEDRDGNGVIDREEGGAGANRARPQGERQGRARGERQREPRTDGRRRRDR